MEDMVEFMVAMLQFLIIHLSDEYELSTWLKSLLGAKCTCNHLELDIFISL
ncbi:hypothetical protein Lalb_Chr06g0173641 [Lupinus albus]|uniref:Uncharacterized protein n=1 Tax=Lupinus albus TaxID=3870 RepID=A0A6A4QEK6_LUPAL|nr:hypothetical protein Lalb_Chr06g0173641 [Lupinus albus]